MLSPARRSAIKLAYSPYLNRRALIGAAAIGQMADDMRVLTANAGGVTADDLGVLGWSTSQIETHGRAARERAYARAAG